MKCRMGGEKKLDAYDLIEIKRATARINRRAWRLGYEGMYSAERRVADFCSRLIKAGGANISHASGGGGAEAPAAPQLSDLWKCNTANRRDFGRLKCKPSHPIMRIYYLEPAEREGGAAFLSPGQCRVSQATCFDIGAWTKLRPFFYLFIFFKVMAPDKTQPWLVLTLLKTPRVINNLDLH